MQTVSATNNPYACFAPIEEEGQHAKNRKSTKALLVQLHNHHDQRMVAPKFIAPPVIAPLPRISTMNRIEAIQRVVLTEFPGVTLSDIKSNGRKAKFVQARQLAMYLAKMLTNQSLPEIGRRMGGRDHTTVLHAYRKMERLIPIRPDLAAKAERVSKIVTELVTEAVRNTAEAGA